MAAHHSSLLFIVTVAVASATGCVPECQSYTDCPDGEYCSGDRVCLAADDGVVPGAGPVTGPRCTARIASVNGTSVAADEFAGVDPLDNVIVIIEEDGFSGPVDFEWTLLSKPSDSRVILTDPTARRTGFTFDDGDLGIDIAGVYQLRGRARSDGADVTCEVSVNAVPSDAFLIELSWEESFGDIDLHLIQRDAQQQFCTKVSGGTLASTSCGSALECDYTNCDDGPGPDYDGDGVGGGPGDPSLDIDDLCGYGPENINVDAPGPGAYLVAVHFFGFTGCEGSGPVTARARFYVDGLLAFEGEQVVVDGDLWEVGIVHWQTETSPCIEDLSTAALECPGL